MGTEQERCKLRPSYSYPEVGTSSAHTMSVGEFVLDVSRAIDVLPRQLCRDETSAEIRDSALMNLLDSAY